MKTNKTTRHVIVFLLMIIASTSTLVYGTINIPRACTGEHSKYKFCDSKLSMDERVKNLISMLNDTEKPYLLTARESPKGSIPRLGIPEYDWGGNCIHGVQSRCGSNFTKCPTSFPDPIFLGATFNETAWRGMGSVIGTEIRSLWLQNVGEDHQSNLPHIGLDCWSPNINIVRDARWGRNLETPGEDPLVNGLYGAFYTIGLQNGSDPRYLQAVTTLKHYDANSLEGTWDKDGKYDLKNGTLNRHTFNAVISKYDLASTYLPAFRRSIVDGGAQGVMCSYNAINGVPSCANSLLLKDLLRDTWGFNGYVTSDSGAVTDISNNHHYTNDLTGAVGAALSNGCDVESAPWPPNHPWGTGSPYIKYTGDAIKEKLMTEDDLNLALYHALMIRFKLGLFDPVDDQPYWHVDPDVVRSKEHTDLAMDTTLQGFVLLKNGEAEPILPFDKSTSTAVIGPLAKATSDLLGNYLGQICPGTDSGDTSCVTSPYDAIKSLIGDSADVSYAAGLENIKSMDKSGFDDAVKVATNADQVVLILGLDSSIEREGQDRDDISLPGLQSDLAKLIVSANPKTVVVLINGGMVAIDELKEEKNVAIIEAFYPGFYGGEALAQTMFGLSNRWGKLPATIYDKTYTTRYNMLDFGMAPHGDQPGRTYRYGGGTDGVLYPFGYGLSYTNFDLGFENSSTERKNGEALLLQDDTTIKFQVENVGKREGDTVVMAFFTPEEFSIANPTNELASALKYELFSFQRVSLNAGELDHLAIDVNPSTLMVYDENGDGVSIPGKYTITITEGGINDENALKRTVIVPGTKKKILQPFLKNAKR